MNDKLKVLDLFSGIGGFTLGLERTGGFETVAFCEIEKYPQKVLKKHWPDVPIFNDVRNIHVSNTNKRGMEKRGSYKATQEESEEWRAHKRGSGSNGRWVTGTGTDGGVIRLQSVDVVTGGFPCQDISVAGKQAGIDADRSGLWSECARLLGEIRPDYAIFENVTALISGDRGRWFQRVLWDISKVGYDAEWHCIPASELGAHHHRDRVWIICYPEHTGRIAAEVGESNQARNGSNTKGKKSASEFAGSGDANDVADTMQQGLQGRENTRSLERSWPKLDKLITRCSESLSVWEIEPAVGRVANGVSRRMDRLKGLGNAVVPQIPELIGYAILDNE